jgi:hypothetical protein
MFLSPTPIQPYTFVNRQSLHDATKFYVRNAQNRDLANLVILDQLNNQQYLANVRYYTEQGRNKVGLNFYAAPKPIFVANPPIQVNTKSCNDKAEGSKKTLKNIIDERIEESKKESNESEKNRQISRHEKSYNDELKKISDEEKKCIEELQPKVQQTGAIVTDGRVMASNQGMLVPGVLPMMPVGMPVGMPVANVAPAPFHNRFVVGPYYNGVTYNFSPVVAVRNNDGLPRYLKR